MPTLEEAEVAFSQWRASKANKYERIPKDLMEMARALVADHGAIAVAKRLRVSSRKFLPKGVTSARAQFVEMPSPADLLFPSVIISVRLSSKKEMTVTLPAGNITAVSDLLKKISKL